MQQDQYIYVCMHLHLLPPNLTSHENNITSHTHTHTYNIRMYITYVTNCLLHPVHISLTHYQSDTPVHAHTYIHTHKLTHLFCAQSMSGEVVNMWGYIFSPIILSKDPQSILETSSYVSHSSCFRKFFQSFKRTTEN